MVALSSELTSMGANVEHAGGRTNGVNCEHSAQSFITLYPEFKIFSPNSKSENRNLPASSLLSS